ncbi:MAG: glutamate--tRNA ligase [Chloroflexi bacterium]|nr:glutamate--tRNA ligase [Chloroflexota bacterium]
MSPGARPVRVRYAPSPTGDPHVGNIRTAIWAWLFARHTGGTFLVRLEDTDQTREVPGSLERILDALHWLGIDWDEGPDIGGPHAPYIQSQRLPGYRAAAERLLETRAAYRCFCTAERLAEMRKAQQAAGEPPGYDGLCRARPAEEAAARAAAGEAHVVRFAMRDEGRTAFEDLLRGEITVENRHFDDFVILKSDGFPTYHLAHVVDDEVMAISHITRGDEWLPSAPRHVRIFDALGYERPVFVHTPVILGPDGGKLSKRHGAKSVLEYAEDGYVPAALFNFLAILGWALDDKTELFTRERLVEVFDIAKVSVNPATFDTQKLEWMNGVYLREMPEAELTALFAERLERDLPPAVPRPVDRELVRALTPLVRERVKLLGEVTALVDFFFADDVPTPAAEEFLGSKRWRDDVAGAVAGLGASAATVEGVATWSAAAIEAAMRATAERLAVRAGDLFTLCRVAVTGKRVAPPLFESMEIVGREPVVRRLRAAAEALRATA